MHSQRQIWHILLFHQKWPETECVTLTTECFASAVAQFHVLSV